MKIKMLRAFFLVLLAMQPMVFAGKSELTSFYPAQFGEYQNLTVSGNVGIGTSAPAYPLHVAPSTTSGPNVSVSRYGTGTGNTYWGYGVKNEANTDLFIFGHSSSDYAGTLAWVGASTAFIYYPSTMRIGTGAGATYTPTMSFTSTGNVGIGVAAPTVQFERACPSGFTNIKGGNNQLGCMQTSEEGSGTWSVAAGDCLDTYGGRLPTTGEWYIALAYFALNDETDDVEWNSDSYGASTHHISGTAVNTTATRTDSTSTAYRCWIPR